MCPKLAEQVTLGEHLCHTPPHLEFPLCLLFLLIKYTQ